MKKIKLLYLLPDLSNAGPVNMCLSLIKGLDLNIYCVHVAALGDGELIDEFKKYSEVIVYSRRQPVHFVRSIKKNNYDIIHSHTIIADLFSRMLPSGIRKITTIHNYPDVDSIYRRGKIIGGLLYYLQSKASRHFFKVACSDSVKRYCQSQLKMDNIVAIPNGVPSSHLSLRPFKSDVTHFYYLGSLSRRKNVVELISGFTEWCLHKNAVLNLIGDGELFNELSSNFASNNVIFHGKITHPEEIVINFDCFVSSSRAEGMPLALLEGLSLGKSYICSNIEPHSEVYQADGGGAGVLYELGNKKSLINAFDWYYSNQHKILLSERARQCFDTHYDMKIMSQRYDILYKQKHQKY